MRLLFRPATSSPRFTWRRTLVLEHLEDRRVLSHSGSYTEIHLNARARAIAGDQVVTRTLDNGMQILAEKNSHSDSAPVADNQHQQDSATSCTQQIQNGESILAQIVGENHPASANGACIGSVGHDNGPPSSGNGGQPKHGNMHAAAGHPTPAPGSVTPGDLGTPAKPPTPSKGAMNPASPSPDGSPESIATGDGQVQNTVSSPGVPQRPTGPSSAFPAATLPASVAAAIPQFSVFDRSQASGVDSTPRAVNVVGVRIVDVRDSLPFVLVPAAVPVSPFGPPNSFYFPATPEIAALMPEFIPQVAGLLGEVIPYDLAALDAGMQSFLNHLEGGVIDLIQPEVNGRLMPWIVAGVLTVAAYEVARRQLKRTSETQLLPGDEEERSSGLRFRSNLDLP